MLLVPLRQQGFWMGLRHLWRSRAYALSTAHMTARHVRTLQRLQDEVESSHDAFLLDPGMGPMTYLTADGRILVDARTWEGDAITEATEDEAIGALVIGAEKTGLLALLALLPPAPVEAATCPRCKGSRRAALGPLPNLLCLVCGGRGWATPERLAEAELLEPAATQSSYSPLRLGCLCPR
jgi:hypothetical protein